MIKDWACAGPAGARFVQQRSPMPFQLRHGLQWCECDGRAVFLDTRRDRYFGLPQAMNEAFLRAAAGRSLSSDAEPLARLVQREVLIEAEGCGSIRPPPRIAVPTHDVLETSQRRASGLRLLQLFLCELRFALALRTKPFEKILESATAYQSGSAKWGSELEIASAADKLAFVTRSHDRCLVRALAVHRLCKAIGCEPLLVFGVIAHPFTAHCWVQLDDGVLVGGYEQARLYTPILVLK